MAANTRTLRLVQKKQSKTAVLNNILPFPGVVLPPIQTYTPVFEPGPLYFTADMYRGGAWTRLNSPIGRHASEHAQLRRKRYAPVLQTKLLAGQWEPFLTNRRFHNDFGIVPAGYRD